MKKRFDRETIIKLIIILAFLLLVFFILSLFIKNVTLEVVLFGLFFLFLAFNYQSDKSKGSSVFIKNDDKKVSSNKAVSDIKENKKEPVKEVYKDTKTKNNSKKETIIKKETEKKKEEVKPTVIIKNEEPKKEKKEEIKKEDKKKVYTPVKVKDKEEKIKTPVKLVLKDKSKDNLKLETKKSEDKINVKNLKVSNKDKLKSNVNIKKEKEEKKKPTITVGNALKNIVSNKKEKLTPSENLMCAELSLFLFEKNSGLSRIPFRKSKDGLITIDSTNIKFKVEQNEKYMLVPKDKIKDPKLKEKADRNNLVKVSLDNGFEVLDEYLSSESKKIREKKSDKLSLLSFFPFTRKISERILKRRQEKAKRVEYLRLYKLYSEIADIYHKSGDYEKEISFLTKAIEKFQSKGYNTLLLEGKLYNAKRLINEKENEKVKRKIKEKKD